MARPEAGGAGFLRTAAGHRGGILFCLALAGACGSMLAWCWSEWHHTLAGNGRWTATKTEMARALLGAQSFSNGRQPLADGNLDLGAWHGHQEVLFERPVELRSLAAEFRLERGAYLAAVFNRAPGRGFAGVRLSWMWKFPGVFFVADDDGGFLHKKPLRQPVLQDEDWHRLRIDLEGGRAEVFLDGRSLGAFDLPPAGRGRVGFRGSFRSARVDNVVIHERDGGTIRERFDRPSGWAVRAAAASLAGATATLLVLLALHLLSGGLHRRHLMAVAMALLVALACAALLLPAIRHRARLYPEKTPGLRQREAEWRRTGAERVHEEIAAGYPKPPAAGVRRLLFVGTSQTWGAGARLEEHVWVRRLETILNGRATGEVRYECVNAGVSALGSLQLLRALERHWLALDPAAVVINLSINDRLPEQLRENVGRMVELSRGAGARPVLVLEPISAEHWDGPVRERHEALRQVAAERDVAVIDMHAYLQKRRDDGFLWWDMAHLTSYGQRLLAEEMAEALVKLDI